MTDLWQQSYGFVTSVTVQINLVVTAVAAVVVVVVVVVVVALDVVT